MYNEHLNRTKISGLLEACGTAQELAAMRANLIEETNREEASNVEEVRLQGSVQRSYIRVLAAKRAAEIKEANRQQWKSDRLGMWAECYATCTPQTIAAILHAAKERGILESYTVTVANGEVLKGGAK